MSTKSTSSTSKTPTPEIVICFNNLTENLKAALRILEDQPIKGQKDEFGQPAYTDGLCSLVDTYQNETEEEDD